jgi:hypothetical protein
MYTSLNNICFYIYLAQVLKTLQDKFVHMVTADGFAKRCQAADTKEEIIKLLESLCGVAKGSRVNNIDKIYDYLLPLLQQCVTLLGNLYI